MNSVLLDQWHNAFGATNPEVIVRAPGRVNIIGEHTDYNEGWVLPGAMSRCMYLLVSRSQTGNHHWIAHDLDEEIAFSVNTAIEITSWAKYIEGAIRLYAPEAGALHILAGGDLPAGAGISSSSALVCGMLYALQQLTGREESKEELALTGSRVEREVIGLQGGIMDQFAIMLSRPGKVMLLDCRTRTYEYIPAVLPGCRWLLINTKVKHQLIDSDYNQRAAECGQAVTLLRTHYPHVSGLRDVTIDMLATAALPEVLFRRALFVLQENDRVHQMTAALQLQDAHKAGLLLQASHEGLRFLYQVSCDELDHLAFFANQHPGVYGARMMGGGFGGCVICLVREEVIDVFLRACIESYTTRFGFEPEAIRFDLEGGVEGLKEGRNGRTAKGWNAR